MRLPVRTKSQNRTGADQTRSLSPLEPPEPSVLNGPFTPLSSLIPRNPDKTNPGSSSWTYLAHVVLFLAEQSKLRDISAQSDSKPVEDLNEGYKAEPEAKSTEATKARDEVQPSHFWRSLEF